ncbi:hypothetical protein J5N97_000325 [Dioscorea zingiberensis]|uniref:Uncharacterized protein n=1 Tax=Dioscorea zingiberensis TaxID=325984 RepID=A0A9D5H1G4_9LILI|nr:hypothetical protein J5N97_000325 [Dioscorea zingiberensis]
MRVKEMHPLCCITLESAGIGDQSPEASLLSRTRSLPASLATASLGSAGKCRTADGIWRPASLEFSTSGPITARDGDPGGSCCETASSPTPRFGCRRISTSSTQNDDVRVIGEISTRTTHRLSRIDSGRIGRRKHQKTVGIVHLKAANFEAEASGIHDGEYQLTAKHEFSSLRREKYSECSTTESSDDIEKQELEEVSDEDELSFFDTKEYFTEPNISCVVHGFVEDVVGKKVAATLFGKWDDSMYYVNGDVGGKPNPSDASLLWKGSKPPNITRVQLNIARYHTERANTWTAALSDPGYLITD